MNYANSKSLQHRSKYRIKKLGEVFTPKECIDGMLALLSQEQRYLLSNENITIFEPCCGHGNIVIHVLEKRLHAIYLKAVKNKIKNPEYYATANAISTLWAIDIDKKNVKECRARIILTIFNFLKEKLNLTCVRSVICNNKEFIAHIICAVEWQVQQNEMLSAMSNSVNAYKNANKTLLGERWIKRNKHLPFDLHNTWVEYFKRSKRSKCLPREFKHALDHINKMLSKKADANQHFDFVDPSCIIDKC